MKGKYLLNKGSPDFYLDLIISTHDTIKYEDSVAYQVHPYIYRINHPYTPPHYTITKKSVADYVTINMVDSKTNKLILSITSEANIKLGDDIPDSPTAITRNLMIRFLKLTKQKQAN